MLNASKMADCHKQKQARKHKTNNVIYHNTAVFVSLSMLLKNKMWAVFLKHIVCCENMLCFLWKLQQH